MSFTNFPGGITSMGVPVVPGLDSGVGLGEVYWVVTAKDTSSLWHEKIRTRVSASNIFTTLQDAHDACTSGQSDTIFVTPGLYTTAEQTTFSKSFINVIGTVGPNNQMAVAATLASRNQPGCTFYCDTAAVPFTMLVTGHNNNFYNLSFVNSGAASTNLGAVAVGRITTNTAHGNYFRRCTFHGCMDTAQNTIANCSLDIGSGSSNYMFEECIIGQNTMGGDRAVNYQGHLHYGGTQDSGAGAGCGPQGGIFKDCIFLSRSAGSVLVPMVRVGGGVGAPTGDEAMDRVHWFIRCSFANYHGAAATAQTSVFDDNSLSWHMVRLVDCSAHSYGEWRTVRPSQNSNASGMYMANMVVTNATNAGIAVEPTA